MKNGRNSWGYIPLIFHSQYCSISSWPTAQSNFRITRLLESHNCFLKREGLIVLGSFHAPQPQRSVRLLFLFVCLLVLFVFVCLFLFCLFLCFLPEKMKNVASLACLTTEVYSSHSHLSQTFSPFFSSPREDEKYVMIRHLPQTPNRHTGLIYFTTQDYFLTGLFCHRCIPQMGPLYAFYLTGLGSFHAPQPQRSISLLFLVQALRNFSKNAFNRKLKQMLFSILGLQDSYIDLSEIVQNVKSWQYFSWSVWLFSLTVAVPLILKLDQCNDFPCCYLILSLFVLLY